MPFTVFRRWVTHLRERRDDFPAPWAAIHLGEIWHRSDIEVWADEHGDELAADLLAPHARAGAADQGGLDRVGF